MTTLSKILITALVSIVVVGGGTCLIMQNQINSIKNDNASKVSDLNSQISDVNKQLADAKSAAVTTTSTPATVTTPATTTTVDPTAGWKTYTDPTFGFSFKYPADFSVSAITNEPGTNYAITPSAKNYSQPLFKFANKLNIGEASTLKQWTDTVNGTSKGSVAVGTFSGVKYQEADGTIDIFWSNTQDNIIYGLFDYSSVLQSQGSLTAAEKTVYDQTFNQMLTNFKTVK
jgi:outer membrane murein-binding lipoprotein Lpp